MDSADVGRFFTRLKEDRALGEEYNTALNGAIETAVAATIQEVGARHGFRFSVAEARAYLEHRTAELSDEQLAAVSGGGLGSSGLRFLNNPWVLGGIVAAAIAIPLALDSDDAS